MPGLQNLPDLQNAEFLPMYLQNRVLQQADQANQFNQVGLQQNQADLEAKGLENLFNRQNNPLKLENQGLVNTGLGIANRTNAVSADIAEGTKTEAMAAKRAELVKNASEADLNKLLSDAQIDMQSNDPAVVARGKRKMEASWGEITRRNKHADEMEKTNAEIQGRKDVANIAADASRYGADASARSRVEVAKAKTQQASSIFDLINTGKLKGPEALSALTFAAQDPELDPQLRAKAYTMRQALEEGIRVKGGANAGFAVTPGANGGVQLAAPPSMSPVQQPPAPQVSGDNMWVGNPAEVAAAIGSIKDPQARAAALQQYMQSQGMAPRQSSAPQTAAPMPDVPAGAIAKLKSNPGLAAAFDEKYGPGTAARILKGQ